MSFDWKSLLGQVAPTLATIAGGPLAGMAVKALSTSLLGHPNGSEADISAALVNATPEQLLALKQADNDFKVKMGELGIEPDKLDVEDRSSARDLAKVRGILPQVALSAIFVLGYFGILTALMMGGAKIPAELHDVLIALLATLSAGVIQVLNFWFGSTHGSQNKDAALANIASGP